MLAVLDHAGVVDDPRQHTDLGRDPLRARTHKQPGIPGRVGEKLLHRLVPGRRLLQPKQRRLQALATTLLDQATHVQERVLTLPPKRQPISHIRNELGQPLAHPHRGRLECECSLHPLLLRTMTATADTVRHKARGPFNELTKSY